MGEKTVAMTPGPLRAKQHASGKLLFHHLEEYFKDALLH